MAKENKQNGQNKNKRLMFVFFEFEIGKTTYGGFFFHSKEWCTPLKLHGAFCMDEKIDADK